MENPNDRYADAQRTLGPLARYAAVAACIFAASFSCAAAGFFAAKALTGATPISYEYRMAMYPDLFTLQYLAALCLPYAGLVALWAVRGHRAWPLLFRLQEAATITAAYLVGSILCGALWALHDMQAGFFPTFPRLAGYIIDGVVAGPVVGARMAARSYPLNVIALGVALGVAELVRLFTRRCPAQSGSQRVP